MIAANGENHGGSQQPQPSDGGKLVATAADLSLVGRAIKERWPISNRKRRKVVNELFDIATTNGDKELRVSAAAKLISADRVNVADKRVDAIREHGPSQHLHLHAAPQIEVVYSDDWYGSKAANLAATDAASNAGAAEPQAVQAPGVRPSLE